MTLQCPIPTTVWKAGSKSCKSHNHTRPLSIQLFLSYKSTYNVNKFLPIPLRNPYQGNVPTLSKQKDEVWDLLKEP